MRALYQFSAGESFLHRLDPRTKLLIVAVLLLATFILPVPWLVALVPIALLWILGRAPPWEYAPFLVLMIPLIVAITIIQALSGGPPFLTHLFGVIPISEPGLSLGFIIAMRLFSMGVAFMMFSMTTDPFDWGLSMYRIRLPYRVAFMFAFAMRFFPLLQEELGVIRNALAARGTDVFSLRHPIRFLRGITISVVPLGVSALRRSQDIALAMELRGFGYAEEAGVSRQLFRDIRLRTSDYLTIGVSVAVLVGVLLLAAALGTLPRPTKSQQIFLAILLALLTAVGFTIGYAVTSSQRTQSK